MKLSSKKILITGADGFIGSHLTEYFLRLGYDVRAFVFYNSFNSWGWLDQLDPSLKKSIDVFAGDIRDPYAVRKALQGCQVVFHLAALVGIPYSYYAPNNYVETNVKGTLNILQAACDLGIEKIIHTSTSEVYGTAQFVPMTEEHPLQAQSPYSATKIAADQMALSFFRSFNLPVSVIRPFNTYGPRQSARAIIPTVISQVAQGFEEIKLGSLYPTRDFTYVEDTMRGFAAIAESDQSLGEVINIGNNFEISMKDLTSLILKLMSSESRIIQEEERLRPKKSEVDRLWADTSKAQKLTGWTPQFQGIEGLKEGLKRTIEWFLDSKNLKAYKPELCNF